MSEAVELTFCEVIRLTLLEQMRANPKIFCCGVETKMFGSLSGIKEEFGRRRCLDLPICEEAGLGFALGAAITGLRPIVNHIRVDFLLLAFNQLVNMVAPASYSSNGKLSAAITVRAVIGRGWGQGHQHSKSMQGIFRQIPGLQVFMPTTPQDARNVLLYALSSNKPTLLLEHRWLYWQKGSVCFSSSSYAESVRPVKRRAGRHITVVATSWMNVEVIAAASVLERRGYEVDLIDPINVTEPDIELILESIKRTGLCLIADNDWQEGGFGTWLSTKIYERSFKYLRKPIVNVGFARVHCPTVRNLERIYYPNAQSILREIEDLLDLDHEGIAESLLFSHENRFFGPF